MMIPMTHPPARRLPTGKLPAQPARPHLRLASGITTLPPPPVAVMYDDVSPEWGMQGNDVVGDCVEAYMAHAIEQVTRWSSGAAQSVPTSATLEVYSAITGYDPSRTDRNGNNPTDQGTVMQDALTYWRKTGVFATAAGPHRIAAFASVALTDWYEIENAVDLFGHVAVGFNFPDSAMDQFDAGDPWTVVEGSPLDGGHCVMLIGYDADWLYVVTWGKVQKMAREFWAAYVDEAWVPITQDDINARGGGVFGGVVDLAALGAAFAALTHDPNPFPAPDPGPAPSPDPVPVPTPDPSPSPLIDAADRALHDSHAFRRLLRDHYPPSLAREARKWQRDKGFPI
jgi:hypothetical protein